ncbi:MAG: hypothetical protein MK078_04875 [Crocinitomicaceae bacterium]|nr:hypothetical protein [Crocinitomicaceae bacterium]
MINITQLIYIVPGKEEDFLAFEELALALMEVYEGKVIHRLRPSADSFIDNKQEELPYEIHFLSFPSNDHLQAFLKDDRRQDFLYLKEGSVKTAITVLGEKLS